jgi:hypothetical protein
VPFTRVGSYNKELQCIADSLVKPGGAPSDKVKETTGVLNNGKSCPVPENPATPTQPEQNIISKNHVTPSPHGSHSSSSYKIVNEELDHEWTSTIQEHAQVCRVSRIDLIKSRCDGWEVVDQYVCRGGCTKEFLKCSSLDIFEPVNQKQGQLPSELNLSL